MDALQIVCGHPVPFEALNDYLLDIHLGFDAYRLVGGVWDQQIDPRRNILRNAYFRLIVAAMNYTVKDLGYARDAPKFKVSSRRGAN